MSLSRTIVAQFARPQGALGRLAGLVMALRPSNRERNIWTVGLLDIGAADRVLEIGCGPGLALAEVLRCAVDGSVVGVDHSTVMIRQAAARNRAAVSAGRLRLVAGRAEDLAAEGEPFDRAFSVNVIQFIADRPAFFRAVAARLRPGGLVATTYMPRNRGAVRVDALAMAGRLRPMMAEAGFVEIRTAELPLDPVPAVSILGRLG